MVSFVSLWMVALSTMDPLFLRMVGQWHGEGEKKAANGQIVRVETEVFATVENEVLISVNDFKEFTSETNVKQYRRIYWMRATGDGQYELGYGQDPRSGAASYGKLDGNVFSSIQDLGGNPALIVESRTEFLPMDETVYTETVSHGPSKISERTIRYRRAD